MNYFRTALLLAALTALFMGVGFMIGGQSGMLIAFVVAIGMNLFSYWNSDKMVLSMHNAQEVDMTTAPELVGMVHQMAHNAGMPLPRVYIIHEDQPNAFATGRNPENAAVAATTGLLDTLTPEEVAGVMAHELAHIKNHDTLIMTITATIAGAISMLANFGMFFGGNRDNNNGGFGWIGVILAAIVAPFAAMIVQMAISRTREYAADRLGAQICGQPVWLASALHKIAGEASHIPNHAAESNPATAHMFIINPLTGQGMDNLFSTHPNTENRITALMQLGQNGGGSTGIGGGGGGTGRAPRPSPTRDAGPRGPWGGQSADDGGRTGGAFGGERFPERGGGGRSSVPPVGGGTPGGRRGPWA